MRAKRAVRRSKHASLKRDDFGQIKNAISISGKPAHVGDRAGLGHHSRQGKGELIGEYKNSHITTLVERHSLDAMLI